MRRRREPTRVDRAIAGSLAVLVVGALAYGVYFVVNIDNYIVPVQPTSRPSDVPPDAVWYGNRGYQEGEWIVCTTTETSAAYSCQTWSDSGRSTGAAPYRYAGVGDPPMSVDVEKREGQTVYLRSGEQLVYAGEPLPVIVAPAPPTSQP